MKFTVYIIFSEKLNLFYVGYTENLPLRLKQHNTGFSKFTSRACDWRIVHEELFATRELAHRRELEIKRKKSRKYIEQLIS